MERIIPNVRDAVGDRDACNGSAILERSICDYLCAVFDRVCTRNASRIDQVVSDIEDVIFPVAVVLVICGTTERACRNTCDAVGNRDACNVFAALERPLPNACDGKSPVGRGDRDFTIDTGVIGHGIFRIPGEGKFQSIGGLWFKRAAFGADAVHIGVLMRRVPVPVAGGKGKRAGERHAGRKQHDGKFLLHILPPKFAQGVKKACSERALHLRFVVTQTLK